MNEVATNGQPIAARLLWTIEAFLVAQGLLLRSVVERTLARTLEWR